MIIVFVRHRTNKNEWLAILSTDLTLTEEEIIRTYSMRWDREPFSNAQNRYSNYKKSFRVDPMTCCLAIQPSFMQGISCLLGSIDKIPMNARWEDYSQYFAMRLANWIGQLHYNSYWIFLMMFPRKLERNYPN